MRTTCWGHRGHRSNYSRLVDNNNIRSSVFDINHLVKIALGILCCPNKKPSDDAKRLCLRSSNLWPSLFDDMYHWAWTATTLVDNVVDLKGDS